MIDEITKGHMKNYYSPPIFNYSTEAIDSKRREIFQRQDIDEETKEKELNSFYQERDDIFGKILKIIEGSRLLIKDVKEFFSCNII